MDNIKFMSLCAACVITVGTIGFSSAAFGQWQPTTTVIGTHPDDDFLTERVSYRDLNLVLVSDEKRLVKRVKSAVGHVCPDSNFPGLDRRNCRSFAWNGAKPQIDLAVRRAREIAINGFSAIAPVTITIALPQ